MTRLTPIWLLAPLSLTLACGDSGGATASDSLSAGSNITGVSASSSSGGAEVPTTSATGGMSEATQGSVSESASQTGDTSTGSLTTGTGGSTTTDDTSTGEITVSTGPAETGTTGDTPKPCQVKTTPIVPTPSDLLLVLDKSGSMSMEKWDHDDNPNTPTVTRWFSIAISP